MSEAPTPKKRRWWRRLRNLFLGLVVLVVVFVLGFNLILRVIGGKERRDAIARLDNADPGWRWDELNAQRPAIAPEENASLKMLELAGRVPAKTDVSVSPNDDLGDGPANIQLTPHEIKIVKDHLNVVPLTLADLRPLRTMTRGEWPTQSADEAIFNPINWQNPRRLTGWLKWKAIADAQEGQSAAALDAIQSLLDVSRAQSIDVPMMLFLVRMANDYAAVRCLERVLGQSERCPFELLTTTRQRFREEAELLQLAPALRRERAWIFHLMSVVAEGPIERVREMAGAPVAHDGPTWMADLWRWEIRGWHWHSQAISLDMTTRAVDIAKMPLEQQAAAFDQLDHDTKMLIGGSTILRQAWNMHGILAVPMMLKVAEGYRRTHALLRSAQAALAAEEFRLRRGRWPNSLDELSKDLKFGVLLDPFDGQPLRWVRDDDGVTIYSIGLNKKDDNGQLAKKPGEWGNVDEGVRLWEPKRRRQSPPAEPKDDDQ